MYILNYNLIYVCLLNLIFIHVTSQYHLILIFKKKNFTIYNLFSKLFFFNNIL